MIKVLWAPIWGRMCELIPSPNIGGLDLSEIKLPPRLHWPGYIAIVPINGKFLGAFEYHTVFTQFYIKIRARSAKPKVVDEEVIEERNRKQGGFQKALCRTLSEGTKIAYFGTMLPQGDLSWEVPTFGSDQLTSNMEERIDVLIAKYGTWSKENLFNYLKTNNMYGEPV